jgi:hypothetical protein
MAASDESSVRTREFGTARTGGRRNTVTRRPSWAVAQRGARVERNTQPADHSGGSGLSAVTRCLNAWEGPA